MIRDYEPIQKTWLIKVQQRKTPTYDKNSNVKLIGTLINSVFSPSLPKVKVTIQKFIENFNYEIKLYSLYFQYLYL